MSNKRGAINYIRAEKIKMFNLSTWQPPRRASITRYFNCSLLIVTSFKYSLAKMIWRHNTQVKVKRHFFLKQHNEQWQPQITKYTSKTMASICIPIKQNEWPENLRSKHAVFGLPPLNSKLNTQLSELQSFTSLITFQNNFTF